MTLPAPGNSISANQINVEATRSGTANAPLSGYKRHAHKRVRWLKYMKTRALIKWHLINTLSFIAKAINDPEGGQYTIVVEYIDADVR